MKKKDTYQLYVLQQDKFSLGNSRRNPKKIMKYGNKKTVIDGIMFDSKKEAYRYRELSLMQKAGKIKDLRLQVRFELIPKQKGKYRNERKCEYIADFVYYQNGETVVEDTKGKRTPDYIIKRKLMLQVHGISVKET